MENKHKIDRLFFINSNKNNLLITIGDSWTWGDSLGDLSVDYRSKHVYGRYLSKDLDCDWINYGWCGAGNNTILSVLDRLILRFVIDNYGFNFTRSEYNLLAGEDWPDYDTFYSSVKKYPKIINEIKNFMTPDDSYHKVDYKNLSNWITKKYQNIYVVVTLTETGRDSYDKNAVDQFTNVKDFLIDDEITVYQKLINLEKRYDNIKLIVSRNFSCDFEEVSNSISVEKNWIQINFEENHRQKFENHNYALNDIINNGSVSGIALNKIKQLNFQDKKQYIIEQIDNCDKLWHWLRNNPLNYNKATCHPTEESHKLWADYLIQYLK